MLFVVVAVRGLTNARYQRKTCRFFYIYFHRNNQWSKVPINSVQFDFNFHWNISFLSMNLIASTIFPISQKHLHQQHKQLSNNNKALKMADIFRGIYSKLLSYNIRVIITNSTIFMLEVKPFIVPSFHKCDPHHIIFLPTFFL